MSIIATHVGIAAFGGVAFFHIKRNLWTAERFSAILTGSPTKWAKVSSSGDVKGVTDEKMEEGLEAQEISKA